jgi:paraquat-inducible protein B
MIRSSADHSETTANLPRPIIRKMRWPYPLIWIVPIVAAIVAGFYYLDALKNHGPEITIKFADVGGLKVDNSTIAHLGVTIGTLETLELSPDQTQALVKVRLRKSASAFARTGAVFWLVHPQISTENISGLTTLASGPYIEATPGKGEPASEFTALDNAPLTLGDGLKIVLHAPRLEHIQTGSAVYYRGVEVGIVVSIQLSGDANGIDVHTFIHQRYARLVHANSRFWVLSGADVKGGLLTGVQVKLESLRSLISGGISFATPDSPPGDPNGEPVPPGADFALYNEPRKDWLEWSPRIPLPADQESPARQEIGLPRMDQNGHTAVPVK